MNKELIKKCYYCDAEEAIRSSDVTVKISYLQKRNSGYYNSEGICDKHRDGFKRMGESIKRILDGLK